MFKEKVDLVRHLIAIQIVEQQRELIAANSRYNIRCPDMPFQYFGQPDQQCVSDGMAMFVIDRLQIVDIDKQNRTIVAISLASCDAVLKAFNKKATV